MKYVLVTGVQFGSGDFATCFGTIPKEASPQTNFVFLPTYKATGISGYLFHEN